MRIDGPLRNLAVEPVGLLPMSLEEATIEDDVDAVRVHAMQRSRDAARRPVELEMHSPPLSPNGDAVTIARIDAPLV